MKGTMASADFVPPYPREYPWLLRLDQEGKPEYLLTTKTEDDRSVYFIYRNEGTAWVKLGQGVSAGALEAKWINDRKKQN